jgi:hypothetical protein
MSIALALALLLPFQPTADVRPVCHITPAAAPAVIDGPHDVVSRTRVLDQPDSPLRILRVDLDGTKLMGGESVLEVEKVVAVTVRNASDRTIDHAEIAVAVRTADGEIGGGPRLTRPLAAGATTRLSMGASRGRIMTFGPGPAVEFLVSVKTAGAQECVYHQSKAPK